MSYLLKEFENLVLTKEKKEMFGIKMGVNYLILPIELDREEGRQLAGELEEIRGALSKGGHHRSCFLLKEKGIGVEKVRDNRVSVGEVFLEKVEEGIRVRDTCFRGEEFINDVIENTVIGTKLKEYWLKEKNFPIPKVEKLFEYVLRGPGEDIKIEEIFLEQEVEYEYKPEYVVPVVVGSEAHKLKKLFEGQSQELRALLCGMEPEKRLSALTVLEIFVQRDFASYKKLDEGKLEELGQKMLYWQSLGLDTGEIKGEARKVLGRLEKKVRKAKEKFFF